MHLLAFGVWLEWYFPQAGPLDFPWLLAYERGLVSWRYVSSILQYMSWATCSLFDHSFCSLYVWCNLVVPKSGAPHLPCDVAQSCPECWSKCLESLCQDCA